jgi:hypothetical protein
LAVDQSVSIIKEMIGSLIRNVQQGVVFTDKANDSYGYL